MVTDFPETRESLLVQVRSPANREAWDELRDLPAGDLPPGSAPGTAGCRCPGSDAAGVDGGGLVDRPVEKVGRDGPVSSLAEARGPQCDYERSARQPHDRAAGGTSIQDLLLERRALTRASSRRSALSTAANSICAPPQSCAETLNPKPGARSK